MKQEMANSKTPLRMQINFSVIVNARYWCIGDVKCNTYDIEILPTGNLVLWGHLRIIELITVQPLGHESMCTYCHSSPQSFVKFCLAVFA